MAGMSPEQIAQITKPPPWIPHFRYVPCRSEETGATFAAHVVESRRFPNGRIIGLRDYKHPEGVYTFQSNGGRVPDGMPILRNANEAPGEGRELQKHQLAPSYLEFWKRDLSRYVGRELFASLCVDSANGLKTPWLEGHVGLLNRDES
jgi:hypothetical protein